MDWLNTLRTASSCVRENHGVSGSNPGSATSSYNTKQAQDDRWTASLLSGFHFTFIRDSSAIHRPMFNVVQDLSLD